MMIWRSSAKQYRRTVALVFLVVALLVTACSEPDDSAALLATTPSRPVTPATLTPPPTTTSAAALATATLPDVATATVRVATPTPTSLATASPTASPIPARAAPTIPVVSMQPTETPVPVPVETPASQAVGLPDLDAHYRLDISELDVDTGYVRASETITISELRGGTPERLFLQVVPAWDGFFSLLAVSLDGVPIQPEVLNDGFTLAVPLAEGAVPVEIAIEFELNVGVEASGWGGTSIDGSVLRMGYWFPINSNDHGYSDTLDPSYTRVASFDVSLVVDADIEFAHTGEIVGAEVLGDGRIRYVMQATDVRDFALALSRDYVLDAATSDTGVTVELYSIDTPPETRAAVLGWATDAIDQMSALIEPYPYPSFRIADAGPSMPGGVEFPGMIYYNPDYYQLDRLIYHEVAHQWLYGIIGTRTLGDGWIDEGGAEFFERGLPTGFTEVPEVPAAGYRYPLDASYDELTADSSRQWYFSIYEQGARFYYQVAWAMGWDAFWNAMQELYTEYAFGIATAWDVLATWQRHSTVDLRPLYSETFRYEWIDRLPAAGT